MERFYPDHEGIQAVGDKQIAYNNALLVHTSPEPYNYENRQYAESTCPVLKEDSPPKLLCGLRRTTFWLTVALAAVISITVVGSSVGGTIAKRNNERVTLARISAAKAAVAASLHFDPATATTTTTTVITTVYQDAATRTVTDVSTQTQQVASTIPSAGCPDRGGTVYTGAHGEQLLIQCFQDYGGNDLLVGNVELVTFDACMDLCFEYNQTRPTSDGCLGISYDFRPQNDSDDGTCYLKGAVPGTNSSLPYVASAAVIKAGMVSNS